MSSIKKGCKQTKKLRCCTEQTTQFTTVCSKTNDQRRSLTFLVP